MPNLNAYLNLPKKWIRRQERKFRIHRELPRFAIVAGKQNQNCKLIGCHLLYLKSYIQHFIIRQTGPDPHFVFRSRTNRFNYDVCAFISICGNTRSKSRINLFIGYKVFSKLSRSKLLYFISVFDTSGLLIIILSRLLFWIGFVQMNSSHNSVCVLPQNADVAVAQSP